MNCKQKSSFINFFFCHFYQSFFLCNPTKLSLQKKLERPRQGIRLQEGHISAAYQSVSCSSAPKSVSKTRGILCKKKKKIIRGKNKTHQALWFAFQEPRWWENNDRRIFFFFCWPPLRVTHTHTHTAAEEKKLLHGCIFFLSAENI